MSSSDHESLYQIRLRRSAGERPWRSLRELDAPPGPLAEFPPGAASPPVVPRRGFLQLLGAGAALGGAGCSREVPRKILPYTRQPLDVTPGLSTFYATSMTIDGHATGLLVESREGRPTKIEPNPEHPTALGGTRALHQAAVWQVYDDCRGRHPSHRGEPTSWEALAEALGAADPADDGRGLRLLLEPTASPLLLSLLERLQRRLPEARVTFHAPLSMRHEEEGARLVFGRPLAPVYDFSRAEVVLALDADFLEAMPLSLRYARQWAARRRPERPGGGMSRLYAVDSLLGPTGSMADHRLRRRASQVPAFAARLARGLFGGAEAARDEEGAFLSALVRDLRGRPPGSTLVLAGPRQPPDVHAIAAAINEALGNLGATVAYIPPTLPHDGPGLQGLAALTEELRAGRVDRLVLLGTNPVYDAPADLGFAEAITHAKRSFCFGLYENETALASAWSAPLTHFLEEWGDARGYDGTVSFVQPLITPLHDARTPAQLLALLAGAPAADPRELLRQLWTGERGLHEAAWEAAVQRGFLADTASAPVAVRTDRRAVDGLLARVGSSSDAAPDSLELELHPSPTLHDGRFANIPWLQELPAPLTKLTWDNAALLSPATARRLGVESEQVVELAIGEARLSVPALVAPGAADGMVALWLGYGRRGGEAIAAGVGVNAYPLRTIAHPYSRPGLRLTPRAARHRLALTQEHWSLHGRAIALQTTLPEHQKNPGGQTQRHKGPVSSLLREYDFRGLQWAMTIDTTICSGCSACMVACQAENNLLVVGKENVANSREMHWLRIDSYHRGPPEAPKVVHQPMLCQHCEKAPCEYVCPVNATVHSPDGLNEMVYNRCVGTRFCSNNCPYKVRRFNWFDWGERIAANQGTVALQYNPEVTVRERGVMEKCTYCVQRIRNTEIRARLEERPVAPGEVVTACQAACPTGAIQFGSLSHRDSEMVHWRQSPRSYAVLHDLGTQPRTMYLARVDNPNPEIG